MAVCMYCWGSHGCHLDDDHPGDHQCLRDHTPDEPETRPRGHRDVFRAGTGEPEPSPPARSTS